MVPLSTRQYAQAFNQPLSFDTSSVTDMSYMLEMDTYCDARASNYDPDTPDTVCDEPFPAFNQPLSLDTSRVTSMAGMFQVHSARALPSPSTVGASLLLAPPTTPPPFFLRRARSRSTSRWALTRPASQT